MSVPGGGGAAATGGSVDFSTSTKALRISSRETDSGGGAVGRCHKTVFVIIKISDAVFLVMCDPSMIEL